MPDILKIYNDNILTSAKFKQLNEGLKIDSKCLMSEFYILRGNNIKSKKFKGEEKHYIPYIIVGNNGSNDYKITFLIDFKDLIKNQR